MSTFTFYVIYLIFGLSVLCCCWHVLDAKTVNLMFVCFFKKSDICQPEVYSECNYGIHYKQVSCMISIWLTRTVWTTVTVDVWSANGTNSKQRLADWCMNVRKSLNPPRLKMAQNTVVYPRDHLNFNKRGFTSETPNPFATLGKT